MTIGVLIPAYNSALVLGEAIASVLKQEPCPEQVVVVDDGSTDGTPRVLDSFSGQVQHIRQSNRGPSAARNAGLACLQTETVVFLDADDLLLPGALRRRIELLQQSGCVWAYTDGWLQTADMRRELFSSAYRTPARRPVERIFSDLLQGNFIPTNAVIIRRDVLNALGAFDERSRWMEDWDLWLRISAQRPVGFDPEPTYIVRKLGPSLSNNRQAMTDMRYRTLVRIFRLYPTEVLTASWLARRSVADAHNAFGYSLAGQGSWAEARPYLRFSVRLWPWQRRAWPLLLRSLLTRSGGTAGVSLDDRKRP